MYILVYMHMHVQLSMRVHTHAHKHTCTGASHTFADNCSYTQTIKCALLGEFTLCAEVASAHVTQGHCNMGCANVANCKYTNLHIRASGDAVGTACKISSHTAACQCCVLNTLGHGHMCTCALVIATEIPVYVIVPIRYHVH